jgi:thioredoxin 1
MLGPVLKDISEEMSDVKFIKINVDNNNVLCQEYSVFSIPAVFIFNGGVKKDSFNGFMPKDEVIKKITAAVE